MQEEECSHTEISEWTHAQGYDVRFCLNCIKQMEEREGHFVVVRQLPKGYLFYAGGKWLKSPKKVTVFVGDHAYEKVYREAFAKYANGNYDVVRVMPWTCFQNYEQAR